MHSHQVSMLLFGESLYNINFSLQLNFILFINIHQFSTDRLILTIICFIYDSKLSTTYQALLSNIDIISFDFDKLHIYNYNFIVY